MSWISSRTDHIWTNTLGKGMEPLILPAIVEIVPQFIFKDGLGINNPWWLICY